MKNRTTKDLVFELLMERGELQLKSSELSNYLGGEEFKKLNLDHQALLNQQWEVMLRYEIILLKRVEELIKEEIKKQKELEQK